MRCNQIAKPAVGFSHEQHARLRDGARGRLGRRAQQTDRAPQGPHGRGGKWRHGAGGGGTAGACQCGGGNGSTQRRPNRAAARCDAGESRARELPEQCQGGARQPGRTAEAPLGADEDDSGLNWVLGVIPTQTNNNYTTGSLVAVPRLRDVLYQRNGVSNCHIGRPALD